MSLATPSTSKKRKHAEKSGLTPESIAKEVRKEEREKEKAKKRDKKGKGRENEVHGEFKVINASVMVSIPPRFATDPMSGVREMLDSLIMRYVPALQGVMLCHSNARFLSDRAIIKNECPFANCTVAFDATVWSPQVGMKLTGRINLCSPDHISLLIHQTFNVSIPRHHIPTDSWEFEYGPAENDPEFGPHAAVPVEGKTDEEVDAMELDNPTIANAETDSAEEPGGSWLHKLSADKLGGKDGLLEFTVVGMTIANQMLSLVGSIQPDPFSPTHVPQPAVSAKSKSVAGASPQAEHDGDGEPALPEFPADLQESDEEEDPFAMLGRAGEETSAEREATQKELERQEKARAKEEKKKRKREKKERKERKREKAAEGGASGDAETKSDKPPKKKSKRVVKEES